MAEFIAPLTIPQEHMKTVCRIGQGADCCAFLIVVPQRGFACAKNTELEATLRWRREAGALPAKGDNCPGALHMAASS